MARYGWCNGGGRNGVRELSRRLFGVAQTSKSAVSWVSKPACGNAVKLFCKPAPVSPAEFAQKTCVPSVLYVQSDPSAGPVFKSVKKVNKGG
jgi:hypothetical protein